MAETSADKPVVQKLKTFVVVYDKSLLLKVQARDEDEVKRLLVEGKVKIIDVAMVQGGLSAGKLEVLPEAGEPEQ